MNCAGATRRGGGCSTLAAAITCVSVVAGSVLLLIPSSTARAAAAPTPDQVGSWADVITLPVATTHTMVLPSGKVVFWGEFDDGYKPYLWDPATAVLTALRQTQYNPFCSGHAHLPDGLLFDAGGHVASHIGLAYASVVDPTNDTWTRVPDMNAGRWYPSVVALATGEMLVVGGEMAGSGDNDPLPQVWDPKTNAWRDLTGASRNVPYYLRMFQAPNGKVFSTIPELNAYWLDTSGTGAWTKGPAMVYRDNRTYGSGVMYRPGKILVAGGGDPPTATTETIDITVANPTWTAAAPMSAARRQQNATILPDGRVLVTGGSSGATFNNSDSPVNYGEVWDPDTNTWTSWASAAVFRGYHSGAVLLPDGRIFTGGGRGPLYNSAQVFQPPYLFKGSRPVIGSAPARIVPGETFGVRSADAASIQMVSLVRLGSVTHAWDMDQRFNSLAFTAASGELQVTAPANNNLAPPGYYMLFLINGSGVPSVAAMVQLGFDGDPIPGGTNDADGGTSGGGDDGGGVTGSDAGDGDAGTQPSTADAGGSDPRTGTSPPSNSSSAKAGCSCGIASPPAVLVLGIIAAPLMFRRRRSVRSR